MLRWRRDVWPGNAYEWNAKKVDAVATDWDGTGDTYIAVHGNRPLIGVIMDGEDRTANYFTEEDAIASTVDPKAVEDALGLAGAWSDLDWGDMQESLDRIRHESTPTPPISL